MTVPAPVPDYPYRAKITWLCGTAVKVDPDTGKHVLDEYVRSPVTGELIKVQEAQR